jgi:hypothetical protein
MFKMSLAAAAAILLAGCATQSTWMGAEAEKQYDKELDAKRLAENFNNDDYYEIHKDGRIYVLADADGYKLFSSIGEIPLVSTQIGAGPKGETLKFALTKKEAKVMETKVGYHGGAQNLYENKVEGLAKGFFGFVLVDDKYFVFDNWKQLDAFRKTGTVPADAQTVTGAAPDGKTVTVYAAKADEAMAKFKALNPAG